MAWSAKDGKVGKGLSWVCLHRTLNPRAGTGGAFSLLVWRSINSCVAAGEKSDAVSIRTASALAALTAARRATPRSLSSRFVGSGEMPTSRAGAGGADSA